MAEPNERSEEALWRTLNQLQQRLERLEQAVYKPAQAPKPSESAGTPAKAAAPAAAMTEAKPAAPVQSPAPVKSPAQVQPPASVRPAASVQTTAPTTQRVQPPPLPPETLGGNKPSEGVRPGTFAGEDISSAFFGREPGAVQQQPQHKPQGQVQAAGAPAAKAAPRQSLEQRLGTRWLMIVGLALTVLACVYSFQLLAARNLITEGIRLLICMGAGVLMVGMGEYWRRKIRMFAAGISAGGIVLLYLVVFVASRNGAAVLGEGYHKLHTPADFICMCLVTLLGMGVAMRNGLLLAGVLSLVGALATPVLLSTGRNAQVGLMVYLLLVNAGFLALAIIQRWQALAPVALAGTAFIFSGWYYKYGNAADSPQYLTTLFAWCFFGLYAAYGLVATRMKRASSAMSPAMVLVMMVLMGVLWVPLGQGAGALLSQMLVLNAVVLGLCLHKRWNSLAALAMVQTVAIMVLCFGRLAEHPTSTNLFAWSHAGIFALFALLAPRFFQGGDGLSRCILAAAMVLLGALWVSLNQGAVALMTQMLILNAVVLGLCLYRRWNALPVLALVQTAALVVICFGRLAENTTTTNLFAWSHATVFAMFALLAPRFFQGGDGIFRCILAAAVALMGALWGCLDQSAVAMLSQLLILDLAVLAICLWRRWQELAPLALVQTTVLMAVHFGWFLSQNCRDLADVFAWVFTGAFAAYAIAAWRMGRAHVYMAIGLIAASCPLLVAMWVAMDQHDWPVMLQMLALDLAVVALCMWARWNWLRAGAIAWTAIGLLMQFTNLFEMRVKVGDDGIELFWSAWIWVFFAMFTADLLVRAWRRAIGTLPDLDAYLAGACNILMFGCTYLLLNPEHHPWMGAYTFALGAAAIALAWVVRRKADRRPLAYAYLGSGLTLVTLAMPIQFSLATLTLAWAVQSVVLMLLAKRLGKWLLLAASVVVLVLAVGHFLIKELPDDDAISTVLLAPLGVNLTLGLALAVAITLACLLTAALVRTGRPVIAPDAERVIAYVLAGAGALIYGVRTAFELPPVAATWWWLALACILAAVAAWRRSRGLILVSVGLLSIVAVKWLFYDTLFRRLHDGPEPWLTVVLNWQMFAGLTLAAALLAFLRRCTALGLCERSNRPKDATVPPVIGNDLDHVIVLLAAVLVVWGGSFEVDRYLGAAANQLSAANPQQAMMLQMGYSWWWAIYALAVLVIGFVVRRAPLRWFAMGLLGLTLCKIFYVIICNVESIYRILALLGVAILLLTAAWMYNRYFRKAKPAEEPMDGPP